MEQDLFGDGPHAEILGDYDFLLFAYVCDKEHVCICQGFSFGAEFVLVFTSVFL